MTLKTKSQYVIDHLEIIYKSSRPRTILTHAIAKNIPQHQQFVESLAKLLEPIRIPSSVVAFAVIRSLASRPCDKGGGAVSRKVLFGPLDLSLV